MSFISSRRTVLAATGCATLSAPALGQAAWPNRPVRLVVPFAPGGALDITARLLSRDMERVIGQSIVPDNKAGAGGNIGADFVARAEPDGYTFLISSGGPLAVNQFLYRHMPYDAEAAFAPIALAVINPQVIMAAPARPERSFADFVATVRSNRPTSYSHSGIGGGGHLSMEVLKQRLGAGDLQNVPFRGASQSLGALAANQVEFGIESIISAASAISGNLARPLAVTTANRWVSLPHVPTVQENGIADFDYASWTAFVAPAGTPPAIIARLNEAINVALQNPENRARLIQLGADPRGGSPDDLRAHIARERIRWREAVRISGATAE